MKYLASVFILGLVIIHGGSVGWVEETQETVSEPIVASQASQEASWVYPIAPGVWYPGDPLPEKAMRYYRVRCWPGCHRGSSHGMYPEKPLNMKPIFPTGTIDLSPTLSEDAE
jgi:hypothetical protein